MSTDISPPHVLCQSAITHVTVHGRGAVIVRSVSIPEIKPSPEAKAPYLLTLVIPNITARALHETLKAKLEKDSPHKIVAIHTEWATHQEEEFDDEEPAEEEHETEEISQRLTQLKRNLTRAQDRRARIDTINFEHTHHQPWLEQGPVERLDQSLKLSKLLLHYAAKIDEYILTLQREVEETENQLRELTAQEAQQPLSAHQTKESSSTCLVTILYDPSKKCESLLLHYEVKEARWWPLYRLLLDRKTNQATLAIDAQVAQDTGETWSNVAISLATSSRHPNTMLPGFDSKEGRTTAKLLNALTKPPDKASRLFEAYEAFEALHFDITSSKTEEETSPQRESLLTTSSTSYTLLGFDKMPKTQKVVDLSMHLDPYVRVRQETIDLNHEQVLLKELSKENERGLSELTSEFGEAPSSPQHESSPHPLRFEAFEIGEDEKRDRLSPILAQSPTKQGSLVEAIKEARTNSLLDPGVTRGHYNYRYESKNRQSIPDDGLLHRIQVAQQVIQAAISWSTTPVEEETVFRLARVKNPFDVPLLSGPVEIFVGGNFLLSVTQHHVAPQEEFELSLGVEEQILVTREVVTEQKQINLHGDKTSTLHIVTTELTSRLDVPADVLVIDRLPVSKTQGIFVKEIAHKPPLARADDAATAQDPKGRRSWSLTIQPGETTLVQSQYAIILDSGLELKEGAPRD